MCSDASRELELNCAGMCDADARDELHRASNQRPHSVLRHPGGANVFFSTHFVFRLVIKATILQVGLYVQVDTIKPELKAGQVSGLENRM